MVKTTGTKKAEKEWYAIHTYSGYEDAVARYLKQRVESLSMEDKIFNVIVPKEKKIKVIFKKFFIAFYMLFCFLQVIPEAFFIWLDIFKLFKNMGVD